MRAWIQWASAAVVGIAIATFAIFFRRRTSPPLQQPRTLNLDIDLEREAVRTIEVKDEIQADSIMEVLEHLDTDERIEAIADLLR